MRKLKKHDYSTNEQYLKFNIQNPNSNTHFIKNLKNMDIKNFFKENNGKNELTFLEPMSKLWKVWNYLSKETACKSPTKAKNSDYKIHPTWINNIKKYFNS